MFDKFSERHIGVSNEKDLKAMLDVIGVKSVDELISQVIPQSIRLRKPLALPAEGMSEYEFAAHIRELADRNQPYRSFIGMGYYPSAVPAVVTRNVFENPAWYTSYTPYQAEISQGRLEALLNFQTAVISLTGMEIGNCSLLDVQIHAKIEEVFLHLGVIAICIISVLAIQQSHIVFVIEDTEITKPLATSAESDVQLMTGCMIA